MSIRQSASDSRFARSGASAPLLASVHARTHGARQSAARSNGTRRRAYYCAPSSHGAQKQARKDIAARSNRQVR